MAKCQPLLVLILAFSQSNLDIHRVPTNLESQGKSWKSQGILDGVREKEEKKEKHAINKRTRNKKRTRNRIYIT